MEDTRFASLWNDERFLALLAAVVRKGDTSLFPLLPNELALRIYDNLPCDDRVCLENALADHPITVYIFDPLFPKLIQRLHGSDRFNVSCNCNGIASLLKRAKDEGYAETARYNVILDGQEYSRGQLLNYLIEHGTPTNDGMSLAGVPRLSSRCQNTEELKFFQNLRQKFPNLILDLHVDNLTVFKAMDKGLRESALTQLSASASIIEAVIQQCYSGSSMGFLKECKRLASVSLLGAMQLSKLEKYGEGIFHLVKEIDGFVHPSEIPHFKKCLQWCDQLSSFRTTVYDPSNLFLCREVLDRLHRLRCWKEITCTKKLKEQDLAEIENFFKTYPQGVGCYPVLVIKDLDEEAWPCLLNPNAYHETRKYLVTIQNCPKSRLDNLAELWKIRPGLYDWVLSPEILGLYPFPPGSIVTCCSDQKMRLKLLRETPFEKADYPRLMMIYYYGISVKVTPENNTDLINLIKRSKGAKPPIDSD